MILYARAFLKHELWGNDVIAWLSALGILIGVWSAAMLVRKLTRRRLQKLAIRTASRFDDIAVHALGALRQWFFMGVAAAAATRVLRLTTTAERAVEAMLVLVLVLQTALCVQKAVDHSLEVWREHEEGRGRRTTLARALSLTARIVIWALALLATLQNLGVEITALVAGLGVGGIAVGLALQNVMADLFAALSIYTDRPFDVGDFVRIGEVIGTVETIGWRSTRIAGLDGDQVILFNGDITKSRIRNLERMRERRVAFELRLVYGMPYEKLAAIAPMLQAIIESVEGTRFDRAHFKHYGEFALHFEAVYYVLSPTYAIYMDRQQEINLEIFRQCEERGIEFAFPRRTVQLTRDQEA